MALYNAVVKASQMEPGGTLRKSMWDWSPSDDAMISNDLYHIFAYLFIMAIPVVEFLRGGTKLEQFLAKYQL